MGHQPVANVDRQIENVVQCVDDGVGFFFELVKRLQDCVDVILIVYHAPVITRRQGQTVFYHRVTGRSTEMASS